VKNHKIAKNSTTTKARETISADLESLEFWKYLLRMVIKPWNMPMLIKDMLFELLQKIK
jgi:hypothetical protein